MKKINIFLVILLSLLMLTACNSGGGLRPGEEKKEVMMVLEADELDIYNRWKNEFEQQYAEEGYKIKFVVVAGGQVQGKQDNLIASGLPADIVVGGDVHMANQYRYLLDLSTFISEHNDEVDIDDFIPEIIDELKMDNKIYYLPNFFNSSLLYYNIDLFDRYNAGVDENNKIDYPNDTWDYETFLSTAKKLTIGSGNSYSQWGSSSTIGWWGEWLIHVRQYGGEIFNNEGYVTLDTPEALNGFNQYLDKMRGNDKVSYITGELELGGFVGGLTAMAYGGHMSDWVDFEKVTDLKWDVSLLPTVNGNRTGEFAVNGLGIHKDSRAKTASFAWIKFLTQKRTGEELFNHPYVSVRISEKNELLDIPFEERKTPKNLEAVYESIEYNKVLPSYRYFTYIVTRIVQTEVNKAVEGILTPEQALLAATTNSNKYINANYK